MTNATSHVPRLPFRVPADVTQWWMDLNLSAPGFGLPQKVKRTKRRYPGEIEAAFVVAYLESLSRFPAKQRAFVKLLRDRDEAVEMLHRTTRGGHFAFDLNMGGFVLLPAEPKGIAALAVLLLGERGRLRRIRRCRHCKAWFYARFAPQQFCSTRCQEDHYHTPQWRKKNRERNRMHQRKYRERNPGRKR